MYFIVFKLFYHITLITSKHYKQPPIFFVFKLHTYLLFDELWIQRQKESATVIKLKIHRRFTDINYFILIGRGLDLWKAGYGYLRPLPGNNMIGISIKSDLEIVKFVGGNTFHWSWQCSIFWHSYFKMTNLTKVKGLLKSRKEIKFDLFWHRIALFLQRQRKQLVELHIEMLYILMFVREQRATYFNLHRRII